VFDPTENIDLSFGIELYVCFSVSPLDINPVYHPPRGFPVEQLTTISRS